MKINIKAIIVVFIVGLSLGVLAYGLMSYVRERSGIVEINDPEKIEEILEEEQDFSKDVSDIKQTAWIPYWDFDRGYDSLVKNKDKFESVSPVWYEFNEDGSLKVLKKSSHSKLDTFCKTNGILLIPTIANFDAGLLQKVLNSPEAYQNHIDSIVNMVEENDYDGIDIDYESIALVDKQLFLGFMEDLSKELRENDRMLTIDVASKWGDDVIYPSLPQTREVQDWVELSKYVDEIRIMTYDYTSFKSENPGPIAPLLWMNEVLEYAVTKIPREKIMLGVHLYAYEWVNEEYDPNDADIDTNPIVEKTQVNAYEYSDILSIKENYEYDEFSEDAYGEVILNYSKENTFRTIFYIDGKGVTTRKELAAKYGIKGVAYWRLGGEDDSGF